MDHTIEIHKKQYSTNDFEKHRSMALIGLQKHERSIISRYFKEKSSSTLEIGCGTGRIAFGIEDELGFKSSNIIATDFVDKYISTAKEIAVEKKSSIEFKTCGATKLPFKDNSFKYVVGLGVVLSHLPHRWQRIQALQECYRVLEEGGILILSTMNICSGKWYMPLLKGLTKVARLISNPYGYESNSLPRLGVGSKFDPLFLRKDKPVLHYYYADELAHDLLSSNFNIVDFNTTNAMVKNEKFCRQGQNIYIVGEKKIVGAPIDS
jgi:ubiquinone/menaquinone biosynthesis C-methylase UbiE